jgi:putative flavoprotein involved in K+ transport
MTKQIHSTAAHSVEEELLIEQGAAFMALEGQRLQTKQTGGSVRERGARDAPERFDVIVIGAGQAGLSTGYHLCRQGLKGVILDENERIGDSWRRRWDSLRLFTPARFDGLDGMPFPAPRDSFPTKDEMAAYLEAYAAEFGLPVRTAMRVDSLSRRGDVYIVRARGRELEASHVVIAAASFQKPRVPSFAAELDPAIVQLHSSEYRNPSQLREGGVLLVGAGNSGAEIGVELARTHRVWLAGRAVGHVPFRIDGLLGRRLLARLVLRVLFHRVLTVDTPIGRRLRPKLVESGGPLLRQRPADLENAGIERVPRVAAVERGRPRLADGRILDVANVVWCTGFRPGLDWVNLPVFEDDGRPKQERGVANGEPGLYFVGLHFEYAMSSVMIHGVGRDAKRIAETIAARVSARRAAASA